MRKNKGGDGGKMEEKRKTSMIDWDKVDRARKNKELRRQRINEARKRGTHTQEEWEELKAEFDFRCVRCGKYGCPLEKDHIVPLYTSESSDSIENIQPLCPWCNCAKGSRRSNFVYFRRRFGFHGHVSVSVTDNVTLTVTDNVTTILTDVVTSYQPELETLRRGLRPSGVPVRKEEVGVGSL